MQSLPAGRKSRIDVNGVSLIDLKAEIARRQGEVKAKATTIPDVKTAVIMRPGSRGGVDALLKPPKAPHKKISEVEFSGIDKTAEENAAWDRARRNLEAKARLYEALKQAAVTYNQGEDHNDDKSPLVDFERKAMEDKRYDNDSGDEDKSENKKSLSSVTAEPVNIPEGPVTYAHLLKGEIRDHGTGFYAFSADAEQRAAEQAALRELRHRTEKARERVEEERAKRSVAMGRRLAQLRARKGLPDVATAAANLLEDNVTPQHSPAPATLPQTAESSVGEQLSSDDLDIASMLRRLRDEAEVKQAAASSASAVSLSVSSRDTTLPLPPSFAPSLGKRTTRDWDRGKSFIPLPPKNSFPTYKQKLGNDRNPDFAPPGFYK